MPVITVATRYDIPEGVGIDHIRHLALPFLSVDDDGTEAVDSLQGSALNLVFRGAAGGAR